MPWWPQRAQTCHCMRCPVWIGTVIFSMSLWGWGGWWAHQSAGLSDHCYWPLDPWMNCGLMQEKDVCHGRDRLASARVWRSRRFKSFGILKSVLSWLRNCLILIFSHICSIFKSPYKVPQGWFIFVDQPRRLRRPGSLKGAPSIVLHFLVSFFFYEGKLNILVDWGLRLGLWETFFTIFWHFIAHTTNWFFEKVFTVFTVRSSPTNK